MVNLIFKALGISKIIEFQKLFFIVVFTLLSIIICKTSKGQDANFSQYYNNPVYYNPSYVGLTKGLKARLHYRRQWQNIPGDFNTYNFSLSVADRDMPGAGGLGLLVNSDRQGIGFLKTFTVGVVPSVRIPLAENFVMQAAPLISFVRKEMNWDKLVFEGQLDDVQGNILPETFSPPVDEAINYPDFSFGMVFQVHGYNTTGTAGFAAHHLTRPNQSFFEASAPMPRRYVVHGDVIFEIGDTRGYFQRKISFKLNPGVIYQYQAQMNLYSVGINLYLSNVYIGLWYRNESLEYDSHSDLIAMGGLMIPFGNNSRMKVFYSYDMQITSENSFTGPSHEVSLVFEFDDIKLINTKGRLSRFRGRKIVEETLECSPF